MAIQPDQTPYETPGSHVHHVHVLRLRSLKKKWEDIFISLKAARNGWFQIIKALPSLRMGSSST